MYIHDLQEQHFLYINCFRFANVKYNTTIIDNFISDNSNIAYINTYDCINSIAVRYLKAK